MGKLFGTDGIRGIANTELSVELALKVGKAVGTVISRNLEKKAVVLIGMDTRISSEMLANAVSAGLCSAGVNVKVLGVVPTPAVAFLINKYEADAGVMISASHNSFEYNGIKVFNREGYKLPDALEEEVERLIENGVKDNEDLIGKNVGRIEYVNDANECYIEHLKESVSDSLEGLKIAVDTANGAASYIAGKVLTELGAEVFMLSNEPDGININEHCGSTDMDNLKEYVTMNRLDAGVAFDGDADRFLGVDELGNEINGDEIMAICAYEMKKQGKLAKDTVIGTIMTNLGFIRFCEKNGINFVATKVGDRFVLEEMLDKGYNFGGEQSGHVIFKEFATTGDGELTAIQLLSILKKSGKKLSELVQIMKRCPQVSSNIIVTNEGKQKFYNSEIIKEKIKSLEVDLAEKGRIVVRPSGTEPKIRVMVEGEDSDQINEVLEQLVAVVKQETL